MTEQEFLTKREPFWFVDDDLKINRPIASDKTKLHIVLTQKYGYNWLLAVRGYWWPNSHVMLYTGDYETPNLTLLVAQYVFSYFPDAKWIGLGCIKGKPGEIWEPKVIIPRDKNLLKDDLFENCK